MRLFGQVKWQDNWKALHLCHACRRPLPEHHEKATGVPERQTFGGRSEGTPVAADWLSGAVCNLIAYSDKLFKKALFQNKQNSGKLKTVS